MKTSDFESLLRGMAEAKAFIERDERSGYVVHAPADDDLVNGVSGTDLEDHH